MKKNQIKFSRLPQEMMVQVVTLNDYFGNGAGAHAENPLTKRQFIQTYLEGGEVPFKDWYTASGDGGPNYVMVTIYKQKVYTIIP